MSLAKKIINDLWLKNRNFCSTDYDECLTYLNEIIPFKIYEYRTDEPDQGWQVPPKWDPVSGKIYKDSQLIFTVETPLQIIGLSTPFAGDVSLEELKKHLFFDARYPQAIPYHFRQNYRPWQRDWGFCVSKEFYDSLTEGNYRIEIVTKESQGVLKVAEHTKRGEVPYGFAFVAHLDHPGMANDDLAGVAVGVELFARLAKRKTKFTYRLLLVQEIIGSYFYLKHNKDENILESCFLEMLGTDTPFAFQAPFTQAAYIEQLFEQALEQEGRPFSKGKFREIICNDEAVWESFGFPMASISRFPYPEYHSDRDNPGIIKEKALAESIDLLERIIVRIEQSTLIIKLFEGVVGLSHPSYNLYVDPGQPAFGDQPTEQLKQLRKAMDLIPLLPNSYFLEQLCHQLNLPKDVLLSYLLGWQEKKLLRLI